MPGNRLLPSVGLAACLPYLRALRPNGMQAMSAPATGRAARLTTDSSEPYSSRASKGRLRRGFETVKELEYSDVSRGMKRVPRTGIHALRMRVFWRQRAQPIEALRRHGKTGFLP